MRQQRALGGWGKRLLACALVGGLLSVALAACAPTPPPPAPPAPYFDVSDLSMDSPTDGWAVGAWIAPANTPGHNSNSGEVMAHFQDGQWRLAPLGVTGSLGDSLSTDLIRMLSPTDGWAVTFEGIEHYDGVRWRVVYPPSPGPDIKDMAFLSHTEGWAVGDYGILQFTHGVWRDVTASLPPRPTDWLAGWDYPGLHSVVVVSATQAWAMGDGGVIWRYDGQQWRIVASPYFPNQYYTSASVDGFTATDAELAHLTLLGHNRDALYASQLLSPHAGWAVGGPVVSNALDDWGPAVVEQYQGDKWQVVHVVPIHVAGQYGRPSFSTLAMSSPQDGWIGGAWGSIRSQGYGDAGPPHTIVLSTLLLHYHAGQWSFVATPAVGAIHRLAMLGPDDGWAAADGGLLHYADGQWRLAPVLPTN